MTEVFIPRVASVFSAYGAATSDLLVRIEEETGGRHPRRDYAELNERVKLLEAAAMEVVGLGQADGARVRVNRKAGMRFRRQVHEFNVALDAEPLTEASAVSLEERFRQRLRTSRRQRAAPTPTPTSSWCRSASRSECLWPIDGARRPGAAAAPPNGATSRRAAAGLVLRRLPGLLGVSGRTALGPESNVTGPAFVELPTTTVVVYPDQRLQVDPDGNMRLRFT